MQCLRCKSAEGLLTTAFDPPDEPGLCGPCWTAFEAWAAPRTTQTITSFLAQHALPQDAGPFAGPAGGPLRPAAGAGSTPPNGEEPHAG